MADTDRTRRFRRARPQTATENPAAYIDARAGRRGTPPPPTMAQAPRSASAQARQDVVDVVAFIHKVDTERSQGRPAPRPQPMQIILGAFHGSPATQTTVQILAAAATARHFGGENSTARKWEKLAQDNAARLDAMRARQYRQEQSRYVQAQLPSEEIDRRISERVTADRETDKRAFDAAGALALSYVAAKSLPPLDKLADMSRKHLTVDEIPVSSNDVASRIEEQTSGVQTEDVAEDAVADPGIHLAKSRDASDTADAIGRDVRAVIAVEAEPDADVSDQLQQVAQPVQKIGSDVSKIGSVLKSAGRGIASAVGPVNGDDEVAPALSPVDVNQLSQELLSALEAAMSGHPRSVTEMLNIERQPDHTNETVLKPDLGLESRQEATVGY
ncbi:hypothetical protein [Rhodococcus pyridinivorans]|uniref:Uncharacterized protein n=1 Tax=Rhodococcus pyridinivorans AK37 TaxID=1114960 RepID=H0JU90_9NOCA|nr:hypothetical protein [Rhodococcus pyridinivorans]EHK82285.1 hypothetical protein AK37_16310 [Rhodococcus pyridinivorans AK37]